MIHITPELLEAAYELLRTVPPFRGWKLPHADDVVFHVSGTRAHFAQHSVAASTHCVEISAAKNMQLGTLLMTLAHELCHMREAMLGKQPRHGALFNKLADQVCKRHGWDRGAF